jgi:hypothetical protein
MDIGAVPCAARLEGFDRYPQATSVYAKEPNNQVRVLTDTVFMV